MFFCLVDSSSGATTLIVTKVAVTVTVTDYLFGWSELTTAPPPTLCQTTNDDSNLRPPRVNFRFFQQFYSSELVLKAVVRPSVIMRMAVRVLYSRISRRLFGWMNKNSIGLTCGFFLVCWSQVALNQAVHGHGHGHGHSHGKCIWAAWKASPYIL